MNLGAGRRVLGENEWACSDAKCSQINSNYRTSCERCGRPKPRAKGKVGHEIGKDAAEKSKGLFAAEDWACSKCGNINWARRTTCNICNAPKLGEMEARTGYGGGYMDRQTVEYIRRDDSDEEYDEFGRKKKKKRHEDDYLPNRNDQQDTRMDQSAASLENGDQQMGKMDLETVGSDEIIGQRDVDMENVQDEEEEDEEAGDLSKYDLEGDEEEEGDDDDTSKYDLLAGDSDQDMEKATENHVEAEDPENKRNGSSSSGSSRSRSYSGSSDSSVCTTCSGPYSSHSSSCSTCSDTDEESEKSSKSRSLTPGKSKRQESEDKRERSRGGSREGQGVHSEGSKSKSDRSEKKHRSRTSKSRSRSKSRERGHSSHRRR